MEELRSIAKAHLKGGPSSIEAAANEFFRSMDADGDGQIDYAEFMAFMTGEVGYDAELCNSVFFNMDKDKNRALNFEEVMALYYAVKSGRRFCDTCDKFIPGAHFTCVACFQGPGDTFDLCLKCYGGRKWEHNHPNGVRFLDNYTMLRVIRESKSVNEDDQPGIDHVMSNPLVNSDMQPPRSRELDPEGTLENMKSGLEALDTAVSLGETVIDICTIM